MPNSGRRPCLLCRCPVFSHSPRELWHHQGFCFAASRYDRRAKLSGSTGRWPEVDRPIDSDPSLSCQPPGIVSSEAAPPVPGKPSPSQRPLLSVPGEPSLSQRAPSLREYRPLREERPGSIVPTRRPSGYHSLFRTRTVPFESILLETNRPSTRETVPCDPGQPLVNFLTAEGHASGSRTIELLALRDQIPLPAEIPRFQGFDLTKGPPKPVESCLQSPQTLVFMHFPLISNFTPPITTA